MNDVVLTGGRYGLGSKDTPPSSVFAIYTELQKDAPKPRFTIGITDDVTNLSLPEVKPAPITSAPGTKECKFWGLGGDGDVYKRQVLNQYVEKCRYPSAGVPAFFVYLASPLGKAVRFPHPFPQSC